MRGEGNRGAGLADARLEFRGRACPAGALSIGWTSMRRAASRRGDFRSTDPGTFACSPRRRPFRRRCSKPEYDDHDWRPIEVPGCWPLQGVGDHAHYTNVRMPFEGDPPSVPDENPTAVYRRKFRLPQDFRGHRAILHIGGAESLVFVYLNGTYIGFGKDSRLPSEFDLTDALVPGYNALVLVVVRYCDASWIEDQDDWWLAGLHRSVEIIARPETAFADVRVHADHDGKAGLLELEVDVEGQQHVLAGGFLVRARVRNEERHRRVATVPRGKGASWRDASTQRRDLVSGIVCWVPSSRARVRRSDPTRPSETPALHEVEIELLDAGGRVVEATVVRAVFRRVRIEDGQLKVNGQARTIRGQSPRARWTSPDLDRAGARDDADGSLLMKRFARNAVRTAHYPNAPGARRALRRARPVGLRRGQRRESSPAHQPSPRAGPSTRRSRSAYGGRSSRDRNHPRIIAWSLGNEAGYGAVHDALAAWIRPRRSRREPPSTTRVRSNCPGMRWKVASCAAAVGPGPGAHASGASASPVPISCARCTRASRA